MGEGIDVEFPPEHSRPIGYMDARDRDGASTRTLVTKHDYLSLILQVPHDGKREPIPKFHGRKKKTTPKS